MTFDQDLGPVSWIVTVAVFAICALSFLTRVYARGFILKSFACDDWFMTVAFVALAGQQYICWKWLVLGGGKPIQAVSSEAMKDIRLYQFIEEFYYPLVQLLLKTSVLLFFRRALQNDRLETAIRITFAVVAIQTIATWAFYALQCRPLGAYFDYDDYPDAICVPFGLTYYAPSAANFAVNLLIYTLPLLPITPTTPAHRRPSTLTTTSTSAPRSRSGPIAMYTLGFTALLFSALRTAVLYLWSTTSTYTSPTATTSPSTSYTYTLAVVAVVTTIELALAFFTANTPAFRTLWRRMRMRSDRARAGEGDEMELVGKKSGGGGGGKITITSRVSVSITEALRGGRDPEVNKDGVPHYPKKYFKFGRPGAMSPGPNIL